VFWKSSTNAGKPTLIGINLEARVGGAEHSFSNGDKAIKLGFSNESG
jgi:hypothetical protein